MLGIDRNTGAAVDDWLQFVQRATRALTTPVGTRQKRPLYCVAVRGFQSAQRLIADKQRTYRYRVICTVCTPLDCADCAVFVENEDTQIVAPTFALHFL